MPSRPASEKVGKGRLAKREGSPCPPYRCGNIPGLFEEYCKELAGRVFADPCGEKVKFFDHNFPKLIQLRRAKPRDGEDNKVKAAKVLEEIRSAKFKEADYAWDLNRAVTLFWIKDVIENPDSIHRNCHDLVMGDRVYVKRYSKAGAPYKLVFTFVDRGSHMRIVTTSFLVPEDRLKNFVIQPPVWQKIKGYPQSV